MYKVIYVVTSDNGPVSAWRIESAAHDAAAAVKLDGGTATVTQVVLR